MALKLIVDKLEDVSEASRGLYVERDGKFHLDVDGLEDTAGLKSALEKERQARKDLDKRLAGLKDVDPDEYKRLKDEADAKEREKLEKDADLKRLSDKLTAKEREFSEKEAKLLGELRTMRLDDSLKAAALAHGVHKDYLDDFVTILKARHVKLGDDLKLQVLDADGDPSTLTLDDLMKEMKGKKPGYFEGSGASGGGSQQNRGGGGGEPNPWKKETFNLTKQGEILTADPARAKALAAEAGKILA